MRNILFFETFRKLRVKFVDIRERGIAQNSGELLRFLASRIRREKLVHRVGMIFPCLARADSLVFQTGKGRQNVDGRIDAFFIKFTRQDDLPFRDISGKVGDRMRFVVFRHGQNGDLRDRSALSLYPAGTFVHGRKVGIQISGVTPSTRNFLSRSGNFAKRFAVIGDIGDDNQNVHAEVICQIFRRSERHFRRGDTLDGGVVRQVGKQNGS